MDAYKTYRCNVGQSLCRQGNITLTSENNHSWYKNIHILTDQTHIEPNHDIYLSWSLFCWESYPSNLKFRLLVQMAELPIRKRRLPKKNYSSFARMSNFLRYLSYMVSTCPVYATCVWSFFHSFLRMNQRKYGPQIYSCNLSMLP